MKREIIRLAVFLMILLLLSFSAAACGKVKPNDGVEDITIDVQMGN